MKQITNEEFEISIASNENVIIEFSAEWCGPCQVMLPNLQEIDETIDNISVFKVNVDEEDELCRKFGIRNVPTTLYYKNGVQVFKTTGLVNKATLLAPFNN